MKKYYLAYGSNLNLTQMQERCPDSRIVGKTELKDYRLAFKGTQGRGYLTIEPVIGATVPLGVFEITEFDEHNLDMYEGYPNFYSKLEIEVPLYGKTIKGLIYIMNLKYPYALPTMAYLATCNQGYIDFGFDRDTLSNALDNSLSNTGRTLIK